MTADLSEEVLAFWIGAGPAAWYKQDADFDAEITARFGDLWAEGAAGRLEGWTGNRHKALALIILLDQFPRNMFRDDARAFATDSRAKTAACYALNHGYDQRTDEPQRQFFYMPFMHSELLTDQDHCVRLMRGRMNSGSNLLHARVHRQIIREFGRFPYRNAALGRKTTAAERDFLDNGGYARFAADLEADAA